MKKIAGIILLVALFSGLFAYGVATSGLLGTVVALAVTILIVAICALIAWLLADES